MWRTRKFWIVSVSILATVLALYAAASVYTSRSAFCNSCHEMTPYYSAWTSGPHAETGCIKCHVDPGIVADFGHKFVALKEVWVHFIGDPTFPQGTADVPNSRCTRCHDGKIQPDLENFDHETHRGDRDCVTCHYTVGHKVTAKALDRAGILNADVQATLDGRGKVAIGQGEPIPDHIKVSCSNCHNMSASTCESCHQRPDKHFTRPCATCHNPSAWTFTHPDSAATCVLCHDRPSGHRDGTCSLCHSTGVSWEFVHPSSTDCAACHMPPANHFAGSCATCHSPGTPFSSAVFKHPSASASCTDCHPRPSGHAAGQCSTCHAPGVAWSFVHPSSASCANCHSAPANHYGSSCSGCHTPSRSWASATFSHPAIPGGEHSYRSFECVKCHPAGYASYSCTACHEGGIPDD